MKVYVFNDPDYRTRVFATPEGLRAFCAKEFDDPHVPAEPTEIEGELPEVTALKREVADLKAELEDALQGDWTGPIGL